MTVMIYYDTLFHYSTSPPMFAQTTSMCLDLLFKDAHSPIVVMSSQNSYNNFIDEFVNQDEVGSE